MMIFGNVDSGGIEFGEPQYKLLLWAVLIVLLIGVVAVRTQTRRATNYRDDRLLLQLLGSRRRYIRLSRLGLVLIGLVLIVGATMRPRSNPRQETTQSKGRDVVFLVDVSRSMLARDVAPNRLERAKLWISDLVMELDTDRVALVAFAGSSSVQSPLTTDRAFFNLALEELSPGSVDIGGTNIGDAVRHCMSMVFYDTENSPKSYHRDIILITDGEDQESLPIEAAQAAGAEGVRILTLGIGSESGTRLVDDHNNPITQNGREVRSRLDSTTLSQIAKATPGGAYLAIGTGDFDLVQVYKELIARGEQSTIGTASVVRWEEHYASLLIPGLALIALEMLLGSLGFRKEAL